ncbi:hypothetical protein ACLOJK_016689 [Asimina triloba]
MIFWRVVGGNEIDWSMGCEEMTEYGLQWLRGPLNCSSKIKLSALAFSEWEGPWTRFQGLLPPYKYHPLSCVSYPSDKLEDILIIDIVTVTVTQKYRIDRKEEEKRRE